MRIPLDHPAPAWAAKILLAAAGLGAALTLVAPSGGAVAAETIPSAGEVEVYLPGPGDNPRHYLTVDLFPERGIAAVSTSQGAQLSRRLFLGNSYAIEIPKTPFDGSIELKLPGVGEVVGTVVRTKRSRRSCPRRCAGTLRRDMPPPSKDESTSAASAGIRPGTVGRRRLRSRPIAPHRRSR